MSLAISIENLSKTFGDNPKALNGVSIDIEQGEIVALIGPSGSGKSTLMRHISALTLSDRDSEINIDVLGNTMQKNGQANRDTRRNRVSIGCIFQQYNLVSRLSVLTNVLIGQLGRMPWWRKNIGLFSEEERQKALAALKRVGMDKYASQRASTLSGGQQQRVAIARALMQEADIILADEPVASLDPESSRIVMEILADINRIDGKTVVITLHHVELARDYCERAIALKDGQLYFDGRTQDLTDARLASLYSSEQISELFAEQATDQPTVMDTPVNTIPVGAAFAAMSTYDTNVDTPKVTSISQ